MFVPIVIFSLGAAYYLCKNCENGPRNSRPNQPKWQQAAAIQIAHQTLAPASSKLTAQVSKRSTQSNLNSQNAHKVSSGLSNQRNQSNSVPESNQDAWSTTYAITDKHLLSPHLRELGKAREFKKHQGNLVRGEAAYMNALVPDSDNEFKVQAYFELAQLQYELKRYEAAAETAAKALSLAEKLQSENLDKYLTFYGKCRIQTKPETVLSILKKSREHLEASIQHKRSEAVQTVDLDSVCKRLNRAPINDNIRKLFEVYEELIEVLFGKGNNVEANNVLNDALIFLRMIPPEFKGVLVILVVKFCTLKNLLEKDDWMRLFAADKLNAHILNYLPGAK